MIVLELSENRFALYGHCIPGSILVQEGDDVVAGQIMAKMGNSGNSDLPHLHFHLSDGPSLFESQGVPYLIDSFNHKADYPYWTDESGNILEMATNFAWSPLETPSMRGNEFVYNGLVVDF